MAQYVTKQDYFDFSGIDLDIELRKSNSDNPSKAVDIFLTRVENWCLDYLEHHYFVNDIDEEYFKKGVLHQIDYVRRHGEISINTGSDIKVLSPDAFKAFKAGGMANTTLPRVPRRNPWL